MTALFLDLSFNRGATAGQPYPAVPQVRASPAVDAFLGEHCRGSSKTQNLQPSAPEWAESFLGLWEVPHETLQGAFTDI